MTEEEADYLFWLLIRRGLHLLCNPEEVDPEMWRDVRRGLLAAGKAIDRHYGTEHAKERTAA